MTPLSIALKQNMERKSRELKTPAFFVFIFVLFNILAKKQSYYTYRYLFLGAHVSQISSISEYQYSSISLFTLNCSIAFP